MSGLDFGVVPVVFDKGLDTKTQRKLVVPGKWDTLVNLSFSKNGALQRRDGFDALIAGATGTALAVRNQELVMANGGELYSIAENARRPQIPGEMPMLDIRKAEVFSSQASVDQQDMAADPTLGYACYVWRARPTGGTVTGLYVTLVETDSGTKLLNNQVLALSATATSPRVVMDGNVFFIFYIDGTSLYCHVVRPTLASPLGAAVALVTNADLSSANFDACSVHTSNLGQRVAVAYRLAAPNATSVQAFICDQTAGVPALIGGVASILTAAQVTEASICGMAVRTFDITSTPTVGFYVLHTAGGALGGGLIGVTTLSGLAIVAGPTVLDGTGAPTVTGPCHVTATPVDQGPGEVMQIFFDHQSSYNTINLSPITSVSASRTNAVTVNQTLLNSATYEVAAGVVLNVAGPQGPFIAGKAFTFGTRTFLPVMLLENYFRPTVGLNTASGYVDSTSAQCSLWFLDTTNIVQSISGTWHLVGGALYGTLGLLDATLGGDAPTVSTPCSTPMLSGTVAGSATVFGLGALERGDVQLTAGVNITPVGLSSVSMAPQVGPAARGQLGETLYFAGGQLGAYDGQQVVQNGFPMYPEGIHAVTAAAGSPVVTVGVHQVVAVYEWTDGAGKRHQSAPSLPAEVTVAANEEIRLIIPTTQLPQNAGWDTSISTLSIVCYMTEAGGLTFYRAPQGYTTVLNDVTVPSITYIIGNIVMTDDRLAQNEVLYTQPSQPGTRLPNVTSGPMHGLGISQNRVWGFLSDEPGEFTYSQREQQNTGLQFFPDALTGRIPMTAGDGVAIAELDEKTILFADRAIYAVFGSGPDPSGANNGFSEPQPVATDVGCVDARSVLLMPMGLIFKSQKGWQLLGRDLSVRFIGDGVERYNEFSVSSAVLMGDRHECRFTSSDTDGPTLVYGYEQGQWSAFYTGAQQSGDVISAVWWPSLDEGRFMQLLSSASDYPGLMFDTPGQYLDGVGAGTATIAPIYARTAFLHASALEGFQRVRRAYLTMTSETAVPTTDFVLGLDFNDIYAGPLSYNLTIDLGAVTTFDEQAVDLRHSLRSGCQKVKSVAFSFLDAGTTDIALIPVTGLQAISLELGLKRGVRRLPAAQST